MKHIIEQRYAKDGKNADEISALCQLLMDTVRSGDVTRDNARTAEISKNGIVAIVRKEPNDKGFNWVLTGFDNTDTAEEQKKATDAIKTVIANNSYAQERSSFREQVGAVIDSITPQKNAVNGKKKDVVMTQEEAYSNATTAELKKEKKKLEGYIANKTRNKRDHFNNIILRENYQKQLDAINDELAKRDNVKNVKKAIRFIAVGSRLFAVGCANTDTAEAQKKAYVANGRLYVNKAMAKKLRSILLR